MSYCQSCDNTGFVIGAGTACPCGVIDLTKARSAIADRDSTITALRAEVERANKEVGRLKGCGVLWANAQLAVHDVRSAYEATKDQPEILYDVRGRPVMPASWRILFRRVGEMLGAMAPAPEAAAPESPR